MRIPKSYYRHRGDGPGIMDTLVSALNDNLTPEEQAAGEKWERLNRTPREIKTDDE